MSDELPKATPAPGSIYRDLDGELVRLVKIEGDLCSWTVLSQSEELQQTTHWENFIRRFRPLDSGRSDGKPLQPSSTHRQPRFA